MPTAELELATTSAAAPGAGATMKALVYHGPGKPAWESRNHKVDTVHPRKADALAEEHEHEPVAH